MPDFQAEQSLLIFVLLNVAVFGSAWFFASRRTFSIPSVCLLDAALLGYAIQYVAVGLPGLLHLLTPAGVVTTALILCGSLVFFSCSFQTKKPSDRRNAPGFHQHELFLSGIALFTCSFVLIYARSQASLPVLSNDALTYQFPAALLWLQQHRICLFQTWFFNPANTYSPLAGSMFVLWLIAPLGSDVLARFVEVPALLCVGLAVYRFGREMNVRPAVAALLAATAVLAKPIFLPCMMAKDDLFVGFFFFASLVALSHNRSSERFGSSRFGVAFGLLLATKYTALLTAPLLLFLLPVPAWKLRQWSIAMVIALLLAGPWYLRNLIATGNPLFPLFSEFTTSCSTAFGTLGSAASVVIGGSYALPISLTILLSIAWVLSKPWKLASPLSRVCGMGIPLGFLLFFWKSPFPEVRFVLPEFLLLFGCAGVAIDRLIEKETFAIAGAAVFLLASVCTVFAGPLITVAFGFAGIALLITLFGLLAIWWIDHQPLRRLAVLAMLIGMGGVYAYIQWRAYCRDYHQMMFDPGGGYAAKYPDLNPLWNFTSQHLPPSATVAYTNMYLIYPLQADAMQRKLIYAPTRPGIKTIADLGWLGSDLAGEDLVTAANVATTRSADRQTWISNLHTAAAQYIVIATGGISATPPEAQFARENPKQFTLLLTCGAGEIYRFNNDTIPQVVP